MPDTPAPAIYAALVRVQDGLGKLSKDGKGPTSQGAYPFLKVDDLVARLQPLLADEGIAVIPRQISCHQDTYRFPKVTLDGQPVADGRPDAFQIITRVEYEFTFASTEDGSTVLAAAFGESADTGDKGIRRASTAAWKEVLLRTFVVVTGEEDPDAFDPNDQPAAVVRKNRGEQAREKAAAEKAPREPRQPRAPRGKAEESAAPATPAEAATPAERPTEAPAAAEPAAPAAPEPTREEKTPAEQRSEDWKPDPEDVAHAVQNAPASTESTAATQKPAPRTPAAPVTPPAPTTEADKRYESVMDIRKAIRSALDERRLDRDHVNALGDRLTGKPRGQWFANLNDLHVVLKAIIEETPATAEPEEAGF